MISRCPAQRGSAQRGSAQQSSIGHGSARVARVAAALLLGVAMTACGGGDGGSSSASSSSAGPSVGSTGPAGSATQASSQTTQSSSADGHQTTTATTSQVARCTTTGLKVSVAQGHPSAGHMSYRIRFQNTSGDPCSLQGYPGVSAVGHDNGTQLGKAASRSGASGNKVTLIPNASGYADIYAVNIGEGGGPLGAECKVSKADGWRIYPPGETRAAYVPQNDMTACTSQSGWLQISAVQPAS